MTDESKEIGELPVPQERTIPELRFELLRKYHSLIPSYDNEDPLLFPQKFRSDGIREVEIKVPPGILTLNLLTQKTPNLRVREGQILDVLLGLGPSQAQLVQIPESGSVRDLFKDKDTLRDITMADFIVDDRVIGILSKMNKEEFDEFVSLCNKRALPNALTSDNENVRLDREQIVQFSESFQDQLRRRDEGINTIVSPNLGSFPDAIDHSQYTPARDLFIEEMQQGRKLADVFVKIESTYHQG